MLQGVVSNVLNLSLLVVGVRILTTILLIKQINILGKCDLGNSMTTSLDTKEVVNSHIGFGCITVEVR